MKKIFIFISLLTLVFACDSKNSRVAEKPSPSSIEAVMTKANQYFMKKFPDPGKDLIQPPTGKVWKSNIWTWGTYATGAMALYKTNTDPQVLTYLTDWGEKHQWKMSTAEMFNDHLAGQTYIDLAQLGENKEYYYKDVKNSIAAFVETGDVQGRGFGDNWNWVDAAYMSMPLFAQLASITGDKAYLDKMESLYFNMKNEVGGGLYNSEDGLWWRDASFKAPYKEPNGEDCYWSRGNGWVMGALANTLNYLPKEAGIRKEFEDMIREMSVALLKVQRPDGMWNVSLHDANHFGGKELTGTALFVYGISWGVNNGILDPAKYKPALYKAWNCMVKECMHSNGFLGFVQGTGEQPSSGQPVTYSSLPDFEDYGLGAFLLAGSELQKIK